jgi:hypothetical protein
MPARRARYSVSFLQPTYAASVFDELAKYAYWHAITGGALPWPVLVRLGMVEGRLVVTGLFIGAVGNENRVVSAVEDEREITSRDLRAVSIPDITETIAREARGNLIFRTLFVETAHPYRRPRRRPGPRGYGREHFRHVAVRYRAALRNSPRSPIATLAAELSADPSTVRRWLGRARDMGFLGPAPAGRAGEQEGHDGTEH